MKCLQHEQLNRITIKGFKSIRLCDLELNNINVLIGGNGAGKSNLISSFTFLSYVLKNEYELYVAQSGMSALFYNGLKTTDKITMDFCFGNIQCSFELMPTDNNNAILYQKNRVNEENSERKHPVSVFTGNSFRVYHFHDTGRYSKIKYEHNISNNDFLQWDASNLAAFLFHLRMNYLPAYQRVVGAVQLVAPYFKDFKLEPNKHNEEHIVLRWLQKGCDDVFNASQLSDGTLRFICLATLLLQPEELQPATIIVDEPELGLHPFAIVVLAEMVRKAAFNKQIILSTQSVELLDQFDVEDIVVVDRGDSGSEFKRLNADELTDWLENDYTLGELWKKNILGGRS